MTAAGGEPRRRNPEIMPMRDFQYYKECFSNLHTAQSRRLPAPHKPLLLLSVIDLIESGVIDGPRIELTDTLIRAFKDNAKRFIGHSIIFRPNIGQPYYHLAHEPFWTLMERRETTTATAAEPTEGYGKKPAVYSIKGLRERYDCALIDPELFTLLKDGDIRAKLRTLLISNYLLQQPNTATPLPAILLLLATITVA